MNYREAIANRNRAYIRWQNSGAGQNADKLQDYLRANIELAQSESIGFLQSGDYVIALNLQINAGHGQVIAVNSSDRTALIKWLDGTHGRYPTDELRFVEYRA